MMKKSLTLAAVMAMAVSFISGSAHAVKLDWVKKNQTVIIDNTVEISKPNKKWDTQTRAYEDPAPVKWVRHIRGANPQMFLRYKKDVRGKTAHHYARKVANELRSRGITVSKIEKRVINNRHVAIVHGRKGNELYQVGVWRHRDIGFQLECIAESDFFSKYASEFDQAIRSVKILKESGL